MSLKVYESPTLDPIRYASMAGRAADIQQASRASAVELANRIHLEKTTPKKPEDASGVLYVIGE